MILNFFTTIREIIPKIGRLSESGLFKSSYNMDLENIIFSETLTTQDLNNLILKNPKDKKLHSIIKARHEYESFRRRIKKGDSVGNSLGYFIYEMIKPNKKEGNYGVEYGYNQKLKDKFNNWIYSTSNSKKRALRRAIVENDFELFKENYNSKIDNSKMKEIFLKAKADFGIKIISNYLTSQSYNKIKQIHNLIHNNISFKDYLAKNYFSRAIDMDSPKRFDYDYKTKIYKNRHGEFDLGLLKKYINNFDYF